MNLNRLRERLLAFRCESGSVESSLVLIPLLMLFLVTLQLIATVNLRNVDMAKNQNQASAKAVYQVVEPRDRIIDLNSGDLFSKLRLLVTHSERNLPEIFPGISSLIGGKKIKTNGLAVYEESEECAGGYLVC